MAELHELYDAAEKLKDAGKDDQAAEKLEELLAVDESYVLAHLALAVIYGRLGRHEDGIRHGQKACEIAPDDPFHFTALSVTYQRASQAVDNAAVDNAAVDNAAADNQKYIMLAEQAMEQAHQLQRQV